MKRVLHIPGIGMVTWKREVNDVGFIKRGSGEVIREDTQKTASTWSEEDEQGLKKENEDEDRD